jgi:putative ABC transport system permease protein
MFKHYLKTALRTLVKYKGYTLINILGLSVGMACCILIFGFILYQLSYDRFYEDADRIYRVVQEERDGPGFAWSGPQMGLRLEADFPQIETVMRFIDGATGYGTRALIQRVDNPSGQADRFNETGFLYADPGFFQFFSSRFISGDPGTALARPGTVVITQSIARKYFGEIKLNNILGKQLMLANKFLLEVTGVVEDPSEKSHLTFNFVTSYQTFYANQGIGGETNSFWWPPTHTYVKLYADADAVLLDAALPDFALRHREAAEAERLTLKLQPLTDIWLGPAYTGQQKAGGSLVYIYLFAAIALFILVLACVNFVNLATARAAQRAREVGVRKVVGAARKQLMFQFISESMLLSLVAVVLAVLLVEMSLSLFTSIAGAGFSIQYGQNAFWMVLMGLTVCTGLAAGFYPALYLSAFRPTAIVRETSGRGRGDVLRKGLVVLQFTVSVVLLVGTAVVYQQLRYINETNLGFDKDHIVVLPGTGLGGSQGQQEPPLFDVLKAELMRHNQVVQVTNASERPGMGQLNSYVWEAEEIPVDLSRQFPIHFVGEGFFEMLDLGMAAGRPLRADTPADIGTSKMRTDQRYPTPIYYDRAFVINETAAQRLGWTPEEALGKQMRFYIIENDQIYQDYQGTVVGVVQDYHAASLYEPIGPAAYMASRLPGGENFWLGDVLVKLAPGNMRQALNTLEEVWDKVVLDRPFEPAFLDESLADLYRSEVRMGQLIGVFTVLAVLIACLGLFGLTSFAAEQRTKEIGIRKVLGASITGIVALLGKDFLKLVFIGFVTAIPIASYAMERWLESFAYRIELQWWMFAIAGSMAILIALLTVSFQSVKAALMNPVESLRSE